MHPHREHDAPAFLGGAGSLQAAETSDMSCGSVALRLPERRNRLRCLEMQELNAGKDLSLLDCSTVRPKDRPPTTPWIQTWCVFRRSAATGGESERGLWRAVFHDS